MIAQLVNVLVPFCEYIISSVSPEAELTPQLQSED